MLPNHIRNIRTNSLLQQLQNTMMTMLRKKLQISKLMVYYLFFLFQQGNNFVQLFHLLGLEIVQSLGH